MNIAYNQSLKSGKKLYAYRPAASSQELADRWSRYNQEYATQLDTLPDYLFSPFEPYGMTRPAYWVISHHQKATTGYHYDWYISPAAGVLVTRDVQKDRTVETMSLSDIIYALIQKTLEAAQKETGASIAFRLRKILHYNVASEANLTAKACRKLSAGASSFTHEQAPEHFLALLGTPNLNSAAHLLHDYGQALGITRISRIEVLDVKSPDEGTALGLALSYE